MLLDKYPTISKVADMMALSNDLYYIAFQTQNKEGWWKKANEIAEDYKESLEAFEKHLVRFKEHDLLTIADGEYYSYIPLLGEHKFAEEMFERMFEISPS